MHRRHLLGAVASVVGATIGGCMGGDSQGDDDGSEEFTDEAYNRNRCPPTVTVNRVSYGPEDAASGELTAEIAVHEHSLECDPDASLTVLVDNRTVLERSFALDGIGRVSFNESAALGRGEDDALVRVELANGTVLTETRVDVNRTGNASTP